MLWDLVPTPRYETNSLNEKPVREHRVRIQRGNGRVNVKQQSTGIPNQQNRSFRDTKRENIFYVSLGLLSSFPDVMTIFYEKPMSLRRPHTYNRACMGQERLSSLALMHIHYHVKIVLDEVVNLFATNTHGGWSSGLFWGISSVVSDKCNIHFLPCTLPLQFLMYCYFSK